MASPKTITKKVAKKNKKAGERNKTSKRAGVDRLRILFAASEVFPLVKTGGLADVAYALPVALKEAGVDVRIVLPAYRSVMEKIDVLQSHDHQTLPDIDLKYRLLECMLPGTRLVIYLVDIPELFDRDGGPYQNASGKDWQDNAIRFAAFGRVCAEMAMNRAGINWQPLVLHCNDWHTGLAPALLNFHPKRPATVFSIHNLAYQGDYTYDVFSSLNLPDSLWSHEAMEFYNRFCFIKGGLVYADHLTTVSPEYAREITTAEFGCGMEGLLRHRRKDLSGILNGADYNQWDPRKDKYIEQNYGRSTLKNKRVNKEHMQEEFGLEKDDKAFLIAHISRMTWQKGTDLIIQAAPDLLEDKTVQMAVLGNGESHYEKSMRELAGRFPGQMQVMVGYDERLSHRMQAGADAMLLPSRYEPCGLTQLYSLRYGTLPIVHNTGGLSDTIVDTDDNSIKQKRATGFKFTGANVDGLTSAVKRARSVYLGSNATWTQLMKSGMKQEFSWAASTKPYLEIYTSLVKKITLT